jgi:hypothetical protein
MKTPQVVWMVDDDRGFREMSDQVAIEAGIAVVTMGFDELAIRRQTHGLPDGIMLDGVIFETARARELLDGIPRIVIATGRTYQSLATEWTHHDNVRVLLKPMSLEDFELAVRWLAGAQDSSTWPTPDPDA